MIWILLVWCLLLSAGLVILFFRLEFLKMEQEASLVLLSSLESMLLKDARAKAIEAGLRSRTARRAAESAPKEEGQK